jgi:hypothetical protein
LFTFGDAVQIEADIASNVAIRTIELEYQSNSGSRIVPPNEYTLTPPFPDTGPGSGGGRRFKLDYSATLAPGSYRYVVRAVDRNGLAITFDVVFEFQTVLRADNRPIITGDPVRPAADLSLLILSPSPIDPSTDMELILNGAPLTFTPAPFNQDTTRREWVLAWSHTPYAPGNYTLQVRLLGQQVSVFTFRVGGSVALENLMAFPNPFDEELGTRFSFTYTGPDVFDLLIKVYTVNGKLIYKREEKSLLPGYHQLPWDGLDAEGDAIANGVYFYTLAVQSPSGNLFERGRLVKLRKPKHVAEEETGTTP